jgi:hypothetical protein
MDIIDIIWGAILIIFGGLLCLLAQVINASSPTLATKLGLNEPESEVTPTFFVDTRGEAIWDALILWTLPVAGLLIIVNSPWWAYFGLIDGGMLVYLAGRGLVVRRMMRQLRRFDAARWVELDLAFRWRPGRRAMAVANAVHTSASISGPQLSPVRLPALQVPASLADAGLAPLLAISCAR